MEEIQDGADTSSIKPLSSLRSKFESLSKQQEHVDPSPRVSRRGSPFLNKPTEVSVSSISQPASNDGSQAGTPVRRVHPGPLPTRPVSMISPAVLSMNAPTVTVESPRISRKTNTPDVHVANGSAFARATTPDFALESSSNGHSRNVSRATTPGLEARMTALMQAADNSNPSSGRPSPLVGKTDANPRGQPPTVNRAAKPKIPAKPLTLTSNSSTLLPPEISGNVSDHTNSPFGTPPLSPETSPEREEEPSVYSQQPVQEEHKKVLSGRPRNDSEASWVQRIRGDSDASIADRARAGSNASFVESSDYPDSWLPQSAPHPALPHRDHNAGLPARYRPTGEKTCSTGEEHSEPPPRLPARPELQSRTGRRSPPKPRSGRSSPIKNEYLPQFQIPSKALGQTFNAAPPLRTASPPKPRSALQQGFDRPQATMNAPPVPAPRRSVDRRREPPPPPTQPAAVVPLRQEEVHPAPVEINALAADPEILNNASEYPDSSRTNRRPPRFVKRPWQIPTDYDTRLFAVCGDYICTTGYITKVWTMRTGETLLRMEHREGAKITSLAFKPCPNIDDQGKRIWLGTSAGEIHELDIPMQRLVKTANHAHPRREIVRMFRYASELWTLDDGGELNVWKPGSNGMPSLDSDYTSRKIPRASNFAIACGPQLWTAHGKEIRVFLPSARQETEFHVLKSPLVQSNAGDVTTGATIDSQPELVYFGHTDGRVSIYNRRAFTCTAVVTASLYRIISLAGVGDFLWAGFSTGLAYVYDTSTSPWTVKKDWQAHGKQICSILVDPSAIWKMGRLNVVTLGLDNMLKIWDGMLEEDWLSGNMEAKDSEYCTFREMTASVMTWNAGASKPGQLAYNEQDNNFFRDYIRAQESPDIFVFGFQEVVDLEDKKIISKSLFRSKKRDPYESENSSHVYRAWRDYLARCLDEHSPGRQQYTLLQTASMVGLFTCIFVKASERSRVRHLHTGEVKRGMGGSLGNKGAVVIRMVLDDSSVCFVNCHLAAGQTQTIQRNNDAAAILEASLLPANPIYDGEPAKHIDIFTAGGDGSMILDHSICVLNGDLNYRIDTMGRDTVVRHVQQGNLARLLERDQLLVSRKRLPGFRLRSFQESPINFAPTYKYNVGTDAYDTSEKRRAPAWCDRILYRGRGAVAMQEYRRWDQVRVSDHRPVSGRLRLRVKTIDARRRDKVWAQCQEEFNAVRERIAWTAQ